jgi:hypothetical protein
MAKPKTQPKRAATARAKAAKKRVSATKRVTCAAPAKRARHSVRVAAVPRRRTAAPAPVPLDEETVAVQTEKHGMIEEAMEPARGGAEDIQRQ